MWDSQIVPFEVKEFESLSGDSLVLGEGDVLTDATESSNGIVKDFSGVDAFAQTE